VVLYKLVLLVIVVFPNSSVYLTQQSIHYIRWSFVNSCFFINNREALDTGVKKTYRLEVARVKMPHASNNNNNNSRRKRERLKSGC